MRSLAARGQVLVLFALFLLLLLGMSAMAIDYASWLLVDRNLQNAADHAALAGASEFEQRTAQGVCTGGVGQPKCEAARAQAWTSINAELNLGLPAAAITQLSLSDSPAGGTTSVTVSGTTYTWQDRVWVTTPPPTYAAYTAGFIGGQYAHNFGVVFARVDHDVRSLIGGALGIQPQPRHGWATAGALPIGFALQTFCRNHIAPQSGVCENSAGLTIDGQGGIRLITGDAASNESLKVTATNGQGIVLDSGDMFLVNGSCDSSTWNCPNGPPSQGGISDGSNGKNAFYMAPLPVPHYESALDYATLSVCPTQAQWDSNHVPCVPFQSQYTANPGAPGDWICGDGTTACGIPSVTTVNGESTISCGAGTYDPNSRFLRPNLDQSTSRWTGSPNNSQLYDNLNDSSVDPAGTLPATTPGSATLTGTPTDQVYSDDGRSTTLRVGLTPPQGIPNGANLTVRYVLYKKVGAGTPSSTPGNAVNVTVQLEEKTGNNSYTLRGPQQVHTNIDGTITVYTYNVSMSVIPTQASYNKLYLRFDVSTTNSNGGGAVNNRGAAVTWGEVEIPELLPPTPPTIKPGYWHSITIPDSGCAILDPSPSVGLQQFQLPGVFRFGGSDGKISIGSNAYLIGDAVSLFFDSSWPDPTGGRGITISGNGALAVNTAISGGYNPSYPLSSLPHDAQNAAWQVEPGIQAGIYDGTNLWPVCTQGGNDCVPRSCYMNTDPSLCDGDTVTPITDGRGISFYFTPAQWPATSIRGRFQNGGGSGAQPGMAFRGVLYAPYDDVKISGSNGFNTIGQVLAWTAKFNGGSAYIYLEYPYTDAPADPYLLEPTVNH